ncbi:hypothetical protein GQ53DRAFT_790151 [Thozetella sp. PMI_491]|nr:hypothetical protein GQ53DRAFT_790151 [Thozetella sp. PMI_491]
MDETWPNNVITDLLTQGQLTKESILERLDQAIEGSYAIREWEIQVIKRVFQSVCNQHGRMTEPVFLSLLQTKAALPSSPEGIEAGKIIFTTPSGIDGLSLTQFTRSLVWLLPGRHASIIEEGSDSRMRTKADHRRLIFQSLASSTYHKPYNRESARQLALHNAFEVNKEEDREFCSLNHDEDGDEIYHDLLDVLYSTQDMNHPGISKVPRDAFRTIGKRLATENRFSTLYALGIPTERLVALVRALLAFQLSPGGTVVDLSQYDAAARSVCTAFCEPEEVTVVTWPMFDRAFKSVAPYLFDPLYRMVSLAFLQETTTFDVLDISDLPNALGSVLTLPRLSQLSTVYAGSAYFGWLRCFQHYEGSHRPSADAFLDAIEKVPGESIVVISGTTAAGKTCTFGLFSPKPELDGSNIQTNIIQDCSGLERCSIFQLEPAQDIFRGTVGKPGWTVDNGTARFGQGSGVIMLLRPGLQIAEISHQLAGVDSEIIVYEPNQSRGNWKEVLEISGIEIWSESEV